MLCLSIGVTGKACIHSQAISRLEPEHVLLSASIQGSGMLRWCDDTAALWPQTLDIVVEQHYCSLPTTDWSPVPEQLLHLKNLYLSAKVSAPPSLSCCSALAMSSIQASSCRASQLLHARRCTMPN